MIYIVNDIVETNMHYIKVYKHTAAWFLFYRNLNKDPNSYQVL